MADNKVRDVFGRKQVKQIRPVTADMAVITWGPDNLDRYEEGEFPEHLTGATNLSINYQQQVIRRRTLGVSNGQPVAVLYPTQPQGSMSIQRLFADPSRQPGDTSASGTGTFDGPKALFNYPGWNTCKGLARLQVTFDGEAAYEDCVVKFGGFVLTGAVVTGYSISAEAEGLTVVDNVNIEFLQMSVK